MNKAVNLKKVLLVFTACFCLSGNNVFASDNVLQAIQIDGVKDSYNIILKSDDVAELKKTIQAPNKMMLNLRGIRASKTINTIYNNTSSVDSVVVEPVDDENVKILVQADNVSNAQIHFDSLKTPLGILSNTEKSTKKNDEIVLSGPVKSYTPVYKEEQESNKADFSSISASAIKYTKKALKNEKLSWMVTLGLFAILIMNSMKLMKGKDSEIKIGLSQSLKEREIELYKNLNSETELSANQQVNQTMPNITPGANYGLRAYQQGTRNPYVTPEIQRPRPVSMPQTPSAPNANLAQMVKNINLKPQTNNAAGIMQNTIPNTAQKSASMNTKTKTANIDSMKFLESMTKIYEKNGRADLAQGLKTNIKKAKTNLV